MPKIQIIDKKGKKTETIDVSSGLVEVKINEGAIHQAVRAHLAKRRAGTADTKTKAEVAGGASKPWRQKGTGRARVGSIRAPHFTGGGTVFGPTPRSFELRLNKKVRKLAFASVISDKYASGSIYLLNNIKLKDNKTREAKDVLDNLKIIGRVTIVYLGSEFDSIRAFRNLPNVSVRLVENVSTYDVLSSDFLMMSKEAFMSLQEVRG